MTVTPLSKAIAFVLFILLPIAGFWLGAEYQKSWDQLLTYQSQPLPSLAQGVILHASDNGTTKYVRVGDSVTVVQDTSRQISGLYTSNADVLQPTKITGSFIAQKAGTAILSGTVPPNCPTGTVCPNFLVDYQVTLVVK